MAYNSLWSTLYSIQKPPWLSRLLRHSARKRVAFILQLTRKEPHGDHVKSSVRHSKQSYQATVDCCIQISLDHLFVVIISSWSWSCLIQCINMQTAAKPSLQRHGSAAPYKWWSFAFTVKLNLVFGTICQQTSDNRTCHTAISYSQRRHVYLVSGTKAQCESPFNCTLEIQLLLTYLHISGDRRSEFVSCKLHIMDIVESVRCMKIKVEF